MVKATVLLDDDGARGAKAVLPMDIHIGSRVKLRRIECGLSAERFADAMGVSRQQVEKWERGLTRLFGARIYEIGVALNINPGWFFEGFPGNVPTSGSPGTDNMLTGPVVELVSTWNKLTTEQRRVIKTMMQGFDKANRHEDDDAA